MSIITHDAKCVVLWYMNGCMATFSTLHVDDASGKERKEQIETVCFTNKAYLAFKQVDLLRIAAPAIPFLHNLSSLLLQNNNLVTLPMQVWKLTSLNELNLGNNQLTEIPAEIGLLNNLHELFLHKNKLIKIPPQIGKLVNLNVLDLTSNELNELPAELLKLNVEHCWLDDNPFHGRRQQNPNFVTLKTICKQIIGTTCIQDEESRKVISSCPIELFNNYNHLDMTPTCWHCSRWLFHSDLQVVKKQDGKIPLVFGACSQSCLIQITK